uniref:CUB_2 domain-containing protein n=1 Tax=Caenorhabditis japonica TaxID=281687 RepID=A0A8R1EBV8_CAEJA
MLKLAAICGIFAIVVSAVDFSCPTNPITNQPLEGNLPTKATDLVIVPKGANCTYNFQIPDGYALQLLLSANFKSDNDTVKVVDNLRLSRALSHANNPVKDAVIWISSGSSQINVIGVTGTSSFMAKYKYTPLNNFVKASKQTGQLFALNSVRGLTYYTITSAKDQV